MTEFILKNVDYANQVFFVFDLSLKDRVFINYFYF